MLAALVILAAVVLAGSTAVQLSGYALYHDELWNHPAAVSLLEGKSWRGNYEVRLLGLPLPVVSGPYQGSLKTYLLAPLLAIFGTSPAALRGIHCALGLGYLAALFWALRAVVGRRAAALVFLLPLADPNLTMFVPTDQGPFLLQNSLLAIALGALLRLLSQPQPHWVLLALGSTSLALADKLTGVPVVAVLGTAALTLGARLLGRSPGRWALAALVALAPLVPHGAYFAAHGLAELEANVGTGMAHSPPYLRRLVGLGRELTGYIAAGAAMPKSLTAHPTPSHRPLLVWVALGLSLAGGAAALRGRREPRTAALATSCLLGGMAALAAVPGLNRPWHLLQLHPLLVIAAFAGGAALTRLASPGRRWVPALRAAAGLLLAAAASWEALRTVELLRFLAERQGAHMYSPGLYALHREVAARRPQRLVCLNYSLCNPLYVLLAGRVEVVDLTWAQLSEGTQEYARHLLSSPGTVMVYRRLAGAAKPRQQEYFDWLNRTSDWLLPLLEEDGYSRQLVADDTGWEFGLVTLGERSHRGSVTPREETPSPSPGPPPPPPQSGHAARPSNRASGAA